ncbi:DUF5819 family protein [Streptomyces sp. NPDC005708]|uniref:DUF5819 family protein n=1 Tax=Streptomyces sp. NPDC005708 TaxID=3154564 RepID=UPI0033C8E0C3
MDTYDKGPDAGREQPGGSDDPVSRLPEGAARDVSEDPAPTQAPEWSGTDGPLPEAPALVEPEAALPTGPGDGEAAASRTGLTALSLPYQIAAVLALAVVAVAVCVHIGMVFLHVAPANTVTKKHGTAIDEWIYPEFEQNWKLFAPNPLQQNIDIQVRADVRTGDGGERTTGWYDLSVLDGAAIDGNPLPSHTQQNELRRAWDFYVASHDAHNRPVGLRGALAEDYLRRVVALRLGREHAAGHGEAVERVQVRSRTTNVPPPKWSDEKVPTTPDYRELPWWSLSAAEWTGANA